MGFKSQVQNPHHTSFLQDISFPWLLRCPFSLQPDHSYSTCGVSWPASGDSCCAYLLRTQHLAPGSQDCSCGLVFPVLESSPKMGMVGPWPWKKNVFVHGRDLIPVSQEVEKPDSAFPH